MKQEQIKPAEKKASVEVKDKDVVGVEIVKAEDGWVPRDGERVMAKWEDGGFYLAEVSKLESSGKFSVVYLEYGNTAAVSILDLAPLKLPKRSEIIAGRNCRALAQKDKLVHDALILRAPIEDASTCLLFFQDFNAQEEVLVQDVFSVIIDNSKRKIDEVDNDVNIPEHLKILPTDSETERLNKKKKLKNLKFQQRNQKQEIERSVKQSEWLSFQNTIGSRRKVGFLSTTKKESIFKSPDTVEGKVGVTGSGKGMTSFSSLGRIDQKKSEHPPSSEHP
jgi:hypothetical protein